MKSSSHDKSHVSSHASTSDASLESAAPTAGVFLTPPPTDAHSPAPPHGFEPLSGATFRGVIPRGTELVAASTAVQDLRRFAATYPSVLGATAPPPDHVIAALTVASAWSGLRVESSAWDAYCATQEGLAWQGLRPMLQKLTAAFELASDSNRSLASEYPGLATLLGSKSQIARKGATTRRLNTKAVAEGKPPYHGGVGKRRQRKAEKAAAERGTADASPSPAPATGGGAPSRS